MTLSNSGKALYLLTAFLSLLLLSWLLGGTHFVEAQVVKRVAHALQSNLGNSFSYQGYLDDGGNPANGSYDFEFGLFDAASGGNQMGSTQAETLSVSDGVFTVELNSTNQFGASAFDGSALYLEIKVWDTDSNSFVTLTPRQALTAVPYAHFAKNVEPLDNIITVAKSGGDFTTVTDALNAITDASATNLYLIRVAPGIYEEAIELKSYVDIEGSGENTTIIRSSGGSNQPDNTGDGATVKAVGNIIADVRLLTIESNSNNYGIAIWTKSVPTGALTFNHVTIIATTTGSASHGIINYQSSPTLNHVTAHASGGNHTYGIHNRYFASPTMKNSIASATGNHKTFAIYNRDDASPIMTNMTATAYGGYDTFGMYSYNAKSSIMNASFLAYGGSNHNYGFRSDNSNISLKNITSRGDGGHSAYGIRIISGNVSLTNVSSFASSGSAFATGILLSDSENQLKDVQASANGSNINNIGIRIIEATGTPDITMNDVIASGSGGSYSYGLYTQASAIMNNVSLSGSSASIANYSLYIANNTNSHTLTFDHSQLSGGIRGYSSFDVKLGTSQIDANFILANGGQFKCINSYDGAYQALINDCTN